MRWLRTNYRQMPGIARAAVAGAAVAYALLLASIPWWWVWDNGPLHDPVEFFLGAPLLGSLIGFKVWWFWLAPGQFGDSVNADRESPVTDRADVRTGALPIRAVKRVWRGFRALDGWAKASIVSAALATVWFVILRLPAFLVGDSELSVDGFREPAKSMLIVYYVTLLPWCFHHTANEIGSVGRGFPWIILIDYFVVFVVSVKTVWRAIVAVLVTLPVSVFRRLVARTGARG